jgi:hypothetical protein
LLNGELREDRSKAAILHEDGSLRLAIVLDLMPDSYELEVIQYTDKGKYSARTNFNITTSDDETKKD